MNFLTLINKGNTCSQGFINGCPPKQPFHFLGLQQTEYYLNPDLIFIETKDKNKILPLNYILIENNERITFFRIQIKDKGFLTCKEGEIKFSESISDENLMYTLSLDKKLYFVKGNFYLSVDKDNKLIIKKHIFMNRMISFENENNNLIQFGSGYFSLN